MKAVDSGVWKKKYGKRHDEIPAAAFDILGGAAPQPQERGPPPPPPQPRRRTIGDRVNELGAWATYQTQHQAITDAHIMHMEAMMQGISLHMGLDTSVYPQPPAFPPPFPFQYTYPMPGATEEGVVLPDAEEEDL